MTTTWNDFFASEVEFDHPSFEESRGSRAESQSTGIAALVGSVSATIVGTLAAVVFTISPPDMTRTRIVQAGLDDLVTSPAEGAAPVAAVPDDALAPAPQDMVGLARILRLGRPADGLDHLL